MSKINLSNFNLRTDLIIEDDKISHSEKIIDGIKINTTKKDGNYITLSFDDVTDYHSREKLINILTTIIKDILILNNIKDDSSCLIIGLGNAKSTPDSIGIKVVDKVTVTSYLYTIGTVSKGMRKVSAFTPGVMGNTGIETTQIITSLIKTIKPDFVIAIDSLAARSIERINKTIQITDTGIHPGSGIGNNRGEISQKTMHVPIIAIGIPTVVMSSTIVYNTINYLIKHISYLKDNESISKLTYKRTNYLNKLKDKELTENEKKELLGLVGNLNNNDKYNLIEEVLNNIDLNMIVTPTEIDFLIDKLSEVISASLNQALHQESLVRKL